VFDLDKMNECYALFPFCSKSRKIQEQGWGLIHRISSTHSSGSRLEEINMIIGDMHRQCFDEQDDKGKTTERH
jgi:hypothetical protein